jgi:hypothetical protein
VVLKFDIVQADARALFSFRSHVGWQKCPRRNL